MNKNKCKSPSTTLDTVLKPLTVEFFKTHKPDLLIDVIFDNFKHLTNYPELKHSKAEIRRIITGDKFYGFLLYHNKKIIAYLIGEITKLQDGRKAFFINYIFVSTHYRNKGLATDLLNEVYKLGDNHQLDAVLLTCDTEDPIVYDFYLKRGYMPDYVLRQYNKYDVLSLPLY